MKRPTCPRCLRPQRTCICDWITATEHAAEVLILQHPLEVDNAKGSARLLHLSLPRSALEIGEVFAEAALQALLHAPLRARESGEADVERTIKHTILLYPDSPQDQALKLSTPPALDEAILREPAQCRLVVLDGTWRKSRNMLYLNPLLQALPRLALRDTPASHYLIRKAHRPEQLSTLEATCYALMQLENNDQKYRPLLDAFDGFVAQQSGYRLDPREAK
ncbi:tRNA-uridine aminocarboxypropyltransferase [Paraherbaspirillum soli]|uniref:tRNA-uridine aminocarboxypropyltransferase n=1 Tax=Paraherbaspirillum soli TaxID=631222 RepID=A0ABW0M8R1_9BURK